MSVAKPTGRFAGKYKLCCKGRLHDQGNHTFIWKRGKFDLDFKYFYR